MPSQRNSGGGAGGWQRHSPAAHLPPSFGFLVQTSTWMDAPLSEAPLRVAIACCASSSVPKQTTPVP
eukprot:CAMPEP_0113824464 /NCGR_PEP_ID=MMETSP0328-20130328/3255_1 /TAXON_ID=39455 /ORGANISM="Alexandrium minutum" /LENGTH=66 /DNA_ID=CAMNT_0000792403 /DNA_START=96 /DNA_END=292 /DNA_ORIENTATION=- /assembly_acc=CAM_ASM_000350